MIPKITKGNSHIDTRGSVFFNNGFDASPIKRFYVIENQGIDFIRAWQGHKIEQRWFSAVQGSFVVKLICIDNWEKPSKVSNQFCYVLQSGKMDILHIPEGYVSSIQSLEKGSKLLVMSDYLMGETQDEFRFDSDYFE